jgi:uncharacterized protein (TIGR03437 family)
VVALVCSLDTASAQNNTLSANPSQLTFNTQSGVTPTPQTVLVSSSSGATNITVTAFSSNNWLVVTPTSGPTPLSLSVSVGAGAPTSGTDVGFINISSTTNFLSIPVSLNANSPSGTSPLAAIPNSLSFSFAPNSTTSVSQTVTVASNNSAVTAFTASGTTSNGGNWLTVFPGSGSVPGTFQVTVNPSALGGAGTFNAAVAINAPGTTGITVPVLVTVAGTPSLNVSPSQLSYAFQLGTGAPAAQNLSITSSTGSNISFTATAKTTTCGNNWLVLSQNSGATPSTLSVQVNTSGLTAGTCTGEVDISAPGASNPNVAVAVNLLVSTNPLLLVPSTGPTFNYQIGGTPPAAQNVQITSSSTALAVAAAATPAPNGPNFLVVTPATGTTPQALSLGLNAAVLGAIGPGTYTETVTITSAGAGNSPQSFPVTLVVSSNAALTASAQSLNFNFQAGQTAPSNQTFTVGSTGAPLNYQVAANTTGCNGFLTATPSSGNTAGNQNQVVVSVNTSGLTPQTCSGNVTLSVPGSSTPPLVIPVTLNVSSTALLNVSQSSINVTALAGAGASTQAVSVTSTDPNSQLAFTATAATNPIGLTWLAVAPNSGNTPNNLQVTINPANLAQGTYTGTITVSSSAPNVPAQTIHVTLVVAATAATANPQSLTFTEALGSPAPASQTVQINGVPPATTIGVIASMFNGTGWLTATVSGNIVTVTANGTQLPQGSYQGAVTVIIPGAAGSPLNIPVTLNVGAAPTLALSAGTVSFAYQVGGTLPGAQSVDVTSTGGNVPFTATFAAITGGAFVTVTPASGATPGALTITPNKDVVSQLAAGNYSGTVTVASANIAGGNKTIAVTLAVNSTTPVVTALTSGASLQPSNAVSPGEIVTIFGTGLAPSIPANGTVFQLTPAGTVPTALANTTVTFNNVAAPLIFVSATQINAIVPYEMASFTTANVVVRFAGTPSATLNVQVVATTPAIFSLTQSGNGQGAILNANSSVNGVANPAAKNSVIQIFATGEGQIVPGGTTGCVSPALPPFPVPVAKPISVTIGGQPSPNIFFAGEAPALVCGVLQINAQVPNNIGSGPQPVVLTVGANTNNQQNITVAIQ